MGDVAAPIRSASSAARSTADEVEPVNWAQAEFASHFTVGRLRLGAVRR